MLKASRKNTLPIIEELLDELQGASWFTSLDLCSGFHQIRMAQGEEFKTVFQTHNGHFEYKVMPYGVTGGPATFQTIMNVILVPLLQICAVVFLIYSKIDLGRAPATCFSYFRNIIEASLPC